MARMTFGEIERNPRVFVPEYEDMQGDEGTIDHATHDLTDDPLALFQLGDIPEGYEEYGDRLDELASDVGDEITNDDQRERLEDINEG